MEPSIFIVVVTERSFELTPPSAFSGSVLLSGAGALSPGAGALLSGAGSAATAGRSGSGSGGTAPGDAGCCADPHAADTRHTAATQKFRGMTQYIDSILSG